MQSIMDKKIAPRQEGEHGAKVLLERDFLFVDFIVLQVKLKSTKKIKLI